MKKKFKSYEEVQEFSENFIGVPLAEFDNLTRSEKVRKNKGYLGNWVQETIFGIRINSSPEPDFYDSGLDLELKVIPFKKLKTSPRETGLKAKERLSLSMINYFNIVHEDFEDSHLYRKHQHIQFIAYLDESDKRILTAFQVHWNYLPEGVRQTIREDYYKIREKVVKGEAHLLSESDTNILAASRKGAGKNRDNKSQPFSSVVAKSRVFSIKPRYIQTLFYNMNRHVSLGSGLEANAKKTGNDYVDAVLNFLVEEAFNLDVYQYAQKFLADKKIYHNKSLAILIVKHLLKGKDSEILKKLELYGYKLRTITINEKNKIQESIPLPNAINPEEFLNWETSFENSDVYHQVMDYKFIFIPVKKSGGSLVLQRPFVFYFSENDESSIDNLKHVWSHTRTMYKFPEIKEIKLNKKQETYYLINFVKESDKKTFHVRPKAKDTTHLYDIGRGCKIVPQAFWINKSVIQGFFDSVHTSDLKNNSENTDVFNYY